MKKIYIAIATAILLGVVLYVGSSNKVESGEIKIGAILPMTGDLAFVGEEMQQGMQLALADYPDMPIKLIVEDDQTVVNTAAVNAANKLIHANNVDVVLNVAVNTQKAIDPVLASAKVPGLVIWDTNKTIASLSEYSLGVGISTETTGENVAQFAYQNRGYRSAAVVQSIDEWAEILAPSFAEEFKRLGGSIALYERTPAEEPDFRTIVAKIKQLNPDLVYAVQISPSAVNVIIKQLRDGGYSGQIITGDIFSDSNIETLGEYAEGVLLAQIWLEDPSFRDKYIKAYGTETNPINLAFAGLAYDAVKLIVDVSRNIESGGDVVSSETLQQKLKGTNFDGITGDIVVGSLKTPYKTEKILKVQNGAFELVKEN